ncbi:MAG: response regulator transcription factor [Lachnospiraceae bacterium]|nr:response regulator transcription factor [Candidatus Minthocola equi]
MLKNRILIVDDDTNISELIALYLTKECFEVKCVADGESALTAFTEYEPDLVLLDLMLPVIDGYQVCREIRKSSSVPIIMMSAKGEVFDKVLGLELGADDYVIKPFDTKELVARVRAVLRRSASSAAAPAQDNAEIVTLPGLVVNKTNYSAELDGTPLSLPPKELELLYFLVSSPNQVFTRDQLLERIWGYDYAGDSRTVDVHIKRLREKLTPHDAWDLTTVWGIGYRFEVH